MYEVFIQTEDSRGISEGIDEKSFFKSDVINAVRYACDYAENIMSLHCYDWWTVTVFDKDCEGPRVVFTVDAADYE